MKKKRINYFNVMITIVFLFCIGFITRDLYILMFKFATWTIFGFITFLIVLYITIKIGEYLSKESNKGKR